MSEAHAPIALPLALALELPADASLSALSLPRDEAAELAARVAHDLAALIPAVEQTRLALAGAWFDVCELLRPGFPVWATLDELARRVPRGHLENIVAFGRHQERMPVQPLEPDPAYANGPMRLLPISLLAPAELAESLNGQLEQELISHGEISAATADWLIRRLGTPLEHVRYLSRNDLIALTCVQYENVNLASLWTLLETALLTPYREEQSLSARGLALRYAHGKVYIQSPSEWLQQQPPARTEERRHALAGAIFELRQYAALLAAHGLPLNLDTPQAAAGEGWLYQPLAPLRSELGSPKLYAHQAPGLGLITLTAAQYAGGKPHLLAHGYPLISKALLPLAAALAERYGSATELTELGTTLLDTEGQLSAPAAALH